MKLIRRLVNGPYNNGIFECEMNSKNNILKS